MNPHVFYTDPHSNPNANQNWTSETRVDLWGCRTSSNTGIDASVSKTIYDPSPSGFCLPASGAFSATTINGNDQSTDRNINGDRFITLFANNQGGYFYCKPMKASGNWDITGGTLFFPNSLGRHNKSGKNNTNYQLLLDSNSTESKCSSGALFTQQCCFASRGEEPGKFLVGGFRTSRRIFCTSSQGIA